MQKKAQESGFKSILKISLGCTTFALLVSDVWAVNGIQLNGYGIT